MSEVFARARRQEVYYNRGKFAGDSEPRYIKAPFDLLQVNGQLYLMPDSPCCGAKMALALLASGDAEAKGLWRGDFGYLSLTPLTVSEHQMGDLSNALDANYGNWMSVHCFAPL